jgi:hypothetical protein
MKLETLKNCITGLITLLICQIIFFTMNETVAGLLMMFGLSIVGLYIFRLINYMRDRTWRLYSKWKQNQKQHQK